MKEPRTVVVYGGPSVRVGRIVCIKHTEPLETMCPNTSRPDRPSLKFELSKPGGMSDLTRRAVHKLATIKTKCLSRSNTSCSRTRRISSYADCPCTSDGPSVLLSEHEQKHENASQLPISIHGSPKRLHGLRKDFGERSSVSRRFYTQKLGASNN
jgi:hypothetical protein